MAPLLASCAFAPGMRFDPQRPLNPEDPSSVPKVMQITPDLVREQQAAINSINAGVSALYDKPAPYNVGPGDILSIVVWDHPELVFPTQTYTIGTAYEIPSFSGAANVPGYVVSAAGDIQFPYVGVLKVVGKNQDQIREDIGRHLKSVIANPQITVRVLAFRSQRVYLDGEVKTPGPQNIDDVPMTLVEALNRAGGINVLTGDSSRIRVSRQGKNYDVNVPALLRQGIDPARILLRNGDIVRVEQREDSKVFVSGEVVKPSTVLLRNGRLTLNEALGDAGGVNPATANAKEVYVIRKSPEGGAQVFHLDGKSPVAMALAEGFELKPKDVVYVDAGGLVRWSRVINLLIPSSQQVIGSASLAK
ncbi:polysaccharide biosynthesis/export family protein [Burkholderia humptydooensis]|uniref:Polysaccharide biosynthesis/export family protein n=2 Tax=Burkholderiaceae TaxID=119060 RepID=A0A7U4P7K0_9BURK|nr:MULTISPECIES: polysaccharide biosynthesis/export family protein [Burkholderia]ALX44337.1 multidrug MFS transporter [Burkholderia humptydooensis]QPS45565.1 polysaccharide biosynthesis/export family protein [Burkholderia humptydooensis]